MNTKRDFLSEALASTRRAFFFVGLFSLAINLLLLTTSIYMMQVFDRVIASGSLSTLAYLTGVAAFALLVLALLETVRIRMLGRLSAWLEQRLAPEALKRTMDDAVAHTREIGSALVDIASIRAFLSGHGVLSLLDAPWIPIYIVVIYFLHPLLGHVALAGAIGLFILAVCNDLLTREPLEKATIAGQRSNRVVSSAVRNAELVDALGLVSGILRRWAGESGEVLRLQSVAGDRAAAIQGLSKFVRLFVQIAIIAVGAYLIIGQSLTGGQ